MKVFISSTYEDLKDYRQAAIKAVSEYEWIPLAMENFLSKPEEPKKVCDDKIKDCDIFVGIYAHRYGFTPNGHNTSITQQEYELAKELGKPCLCFIVGKSFPWNPEFMEYKKFDELNAFLNIVKEKEVVTSFRSVEDFKGKLSASLGNLKGTGKKPEGGVCIIPKAPAPYIAHPYPLPDHFTGRDAERAKLANWFHNEQEPVLVLEAIGGMGKSALSWVWLRKDVRERSTEVDGIFWWSFYDEPFETFIQHLYCYVFGIEDNTGGPVTIDVTRLIAVLQHRRFLLVLDGLERALRGYAGMEAMFIQEKRFAGDKEAENHWEQRQREPIHPMAAKFLQYLSVGNGKTLITTRLFPAPLEGLAGVKQVFLRGLSEQDAVSFLRSEGIKGTRGEMVQAGAVYDFHPLMLKLLSTAITRSRAKDIQAAFRLHLIDRAEPHKILERGFKLLSKEEREVVSKVAVFRGTFTFDPAKALFPDMEEERLWQVLLELRGLGFLFYNDREARFDFHPILRSFLYNGLTKRKKVHTLAVHYFQALPKAEKVVSLEDLAPVIELYHHLVKAEKFAEARELFRDRLHKQCYYQLSAYHLYIELLKELFPGGEDGEDRLPRLKKEADQAWVLTALANSYSLSGQPARAVPLFLKSIFPDDEKNDKEGVAISLGNVASMAQIQIGQLSAAAGHLRKSISLCREIKDEFNEAVGHRELGRVLAYRGETDAAAGELNQAFELFEKDDYIQSLSVVSAYRSLSALLQARLAAMLPGKEKECAVRTREALDLALQSLAFAEKDAKSVYPMPRDFVRAYWLLGEALIQCRTSSTADNSKPFSIHFYDEHFQKITETHEYKKGSELSLAERCLNEALRRCRKASMVDHEPDILLSLARLEKAKNKPGDAEALLKEALDIAQRAGYRRYLADLHLLCGQILLEDKCRDHRLLGFTARGHLQKAKGYALDVSELDDLYKPIDPHFYDGIPEYQMLKRGMTEEEKVRNGYRVAYEIAEALEKREEGKCEVQSSKFKG